MTRLFNILFGCWHPKHRRSWPISKVEGKRCDPYQQCLECGAKLHYVGELVA